MRALFAHFHTHELEAQCPTGVTHALLLHLRTHPGSRPVKDMSNSRLRDCETPNVVATAKSKHSRKAKTDNEAWGSDYAVVIENPSAQWPLQAC